MAHRGNLVVGGKLLPNQHGIDRICSLVSTSNHTEMFVILLVDSKKTQNPYEIGKWRFNICIINVFWKGITKESNTNAVLPNYSIKGFHMLVVKFIF